VRRYLSLDAVIATIKTERLRFTRVDQFQDPFEGSVPQEQLNDQIVILIGAASRRTMINSVATHYPRMGRVEPPGEDPWDRITRLRRARTRSAHASCWSAGPESEPLWRAYCADDGCRGVGVALCTTLARLELSVATHDLYVSPVTYIQYREAPAFTDEMDSLLHKRDAFSDEREVRLLKFDEAHYGALASKSATVSELPKHISLDWILSDVIEEIIVSPYANVDYEGRVHRVIKAANPSLCDCVMLSELHERRYAPGF
jgi:hypothetical protein